MEVSDRFMGVGSFNSERCPWCDLIKKFLRMRMRNLLIIRGMRFSIPTRFRKIFRVGTLSSSSFIDLPDPSGPALVRETPT